MCWCVQFDPRYTVIRSLDRCCSRERHRYIELCSSLSLSELHARSPSICMWRGGYIRCCVAGGFASSAVTKKNTPALSASDIFSFVFLCYDIIFDYHFLVDSGCRPFCFPFSFVASTKNNNPFQLPSKDPATLDTRNDPRKKKRFPRQLSTKKHNRNAFSPLPRAPGMLCYIYKVLQSGGPRYFILFACSLLGDEATERERVTHTPTR